MAKLNARGRTVQVEASREYSESQLQAAHDRHNPDGLPSLCIWERRTRRVMSDGKVLEKLDVRFRPSPNAPWEDPRGEKHSYGWKVHGKLKTGKTADDYARIYEAPRKDGSPSPWTVTRTNGVKMETLSGFHKSLTLGRVTRAVKAQMSDLSNPGFCASCGSEADGCEPDARNYKCESCGRMEVFGAEELLNMLG
jgi:hypothetical protein